MATFKETLVIFPENNVPPARRVTLKDLVICGTSEFFGTAVLLFLSCTGATLDIQGDATVLHVSMAAGLAVTVVIQMLGHISGAYVNPVVTLSAYILGEINLKQTLLYVVCQISGCLCGTGFHRAFGVEIILTIILVIANCSSWDKRNSHKSDSVPIKIGLVVVALNVSAAAYTGASMNPARSFGPAVWSSDYKSHWIYWTAPTIGSLLASYAYKYVFLERNE
ncbi:aquaporin AQPcic isoform X3 [Diabrotica virgifera virgifera]|uniref:Aquaporin AQPcic-like n=1 Tax=Diabrotica virgifera virgifera TaxID=50390 RepID=A0ABM5IK47_DIAVI|nr:aquaporin AQPcic isoform X3 [Diabrotica virgifera virgifera]